MMLSERQKTAAAVTAELQKLGNVWVTSVMPLPDHAPLVFHVLDSDREFILEKLLSWGWSPILKNTVPRFTSRGPSPATTYELDLPKPRVVVVDTRMIPRSEVEQERRQSKDEVAAMRRHLGLIT
jgi:hypothetical protein